MTEEQKAIILDFATGNKSRRNEAIVIYRQLIQKYGTNPKDPFFNFMSEVDNPCPDLALRARYRAALLKIRLNRLVG
jgi:hypothetical protein